MKLAYILILFAAVTETCAQVSLLTAGEGKSSILQELLSDDTLISANTSDKSVTFSKLIRSSSAGKQFVFGGWQVSVAGKNGKFPTFKHEPANYEVAMNFAFYVFPRRGSSNIYFYAMPNFKGGRIVTITPSVAEPFLTDFETTYKSTLQLGFNFFPTSASTSPYLFDVSNLVLGVAIDFGYDDNSERIDNFQYGNATYTGVDQNGKAVYVTTDENFGYQQDEFREGVLYSNPMVDIGYYFRRVLVAGHLRWDSYTGDSKRTYFSPALGAYLTKRQERSKILFGLQALIEDATNLNGSDDSHWERMKFSIVIGFDL